MYFKIIFFNFDKLKVFISLISSNSNKLLKKINVGFSIPNNNMFNKHLYIFN